jgi:hypothetical protein
VITAATTALIPGVPLSWLPATFKVADRVLGQPLARPHDRLADRQVG